MPMPLWEELGRLNASDENAVRAFALKWNYVQPDEDNLWMPLVEPDGKLKSDALIAFHQWHGLFKLALEEGRRLTVAILQGDRQAAIEAAEDLQAHSSDFLEGQFAASTLIGTTSSGFPRLTRFYAPSDVVMNWRRNRLYLTLGTIFNEFVADLLENQPILRCAHCGHEFLGNEQQRAKLKKWRRRKFHARCSECRTNPLIKDHELRDRPLEYFRKKMRQRRRRKPTSKTRASNDTRPAQRRSL